MAIKKSKKARRILLCGSSTKALSPRQTKIRPGSPITPRSGTASPTGGRYKIGLFERIRLFFVRYKERLYMRRRMKRLTRIIAEESVTTHESIAKVPSLPAIMESPEVKDDDLNSHNNLHLEKITSLKALCKELEPITDVKKQSCHGNKHDSDEGSISDFNDIFNDESLTDSNKCSSAVIPQPEARKSTHSYVPLKNQIPYEKDNKTTSVWKSENKSLDQYSVTAVESTCAVTDYPKSHFSEEAVSEKRHNRNRNMGRRNQNDAFQDHNDKKDERNLEVKKKKSHTKRVHFNLEPIIIHLPEDPVYSKPPMVPEQYYINRRQEKLANGSMNKAQKRHEITMSDSSTSSNTEFEVDIVRPKRDKSLDGKIHPAVAKKCQSKPRTNAIKASSFEQEKPSENSSAYTKIPNNRASSFEQEKPSENSAAYTRIPNNRASYFEQKKLSENSSVHTRIPNNRASSFEQEKPSENSAAYTRIPNNRASSFEQKKLSENSSVHTRISSNRASSFEQDKPSENSTAYTGIPNNRISSYEEDKLSENISVHARIPNNRASSFQQDKPSENSAAHTRNPNNRASFEQGKPSENGSVHTRIPNNRASSFEQGKPSENGSVYTRISNNGASSFQQDKSSENSSANTKIPNNRGSSFEQNKTSGNSRLDTGIPDNKVKVIKKEETEENLYSIKPESKTNTDDADLIREIERFAKNIVQNATTGCLEKAEVGSTARNDRYSANKSSFSLFDNGNAPQRNLVKEILCHVKGPDYIVPNLENHDDDDDDDDMNTYSENSTTGDKKDKLRKLDAYFGDSDESFQYAEYEATDSEGDFDHDGMNDFPESRQPSSDERHSDVSGWNKDENLAEYLSSYTAQLAGDNAMSVYRSHTRELEIHDPERNRDPHCYPPLTPKAPALAPNPFPVDKHNLPAVYSPRKAEYHDYTETKKMKKSSKKSRRKEKRNETYIETTHELGLLKEVTNRWEPTPSLFLGKKQEPEDISIKPKIYEPLLPIAGSRTSPVSNDVLFPNSAKNSQLPVTEVYTQPMGKLSSKGRDSSGIDVSCFTGEYPVEQPEPPKRKKERKHRKHKDGKPSDPYPAVAKENMDMYRKMECTFKARETEVPDAKFWIDLNKGKYELETDNRIKPKTKPKRNKPKKAWEPTSTSEQINTSSNSSRDHLPDELNRKEPLSPIGSNMSKRVSYDKAKENFHYFKAAASVDRDEVRRIEDMQTDKRVLQKFNCVKKPLKPIEDVLPEEKASHAENMHFFKNITTTPAFWSDNVVPQEKKPKRYIPKKPLNPIPTNSPESPSSPAENMEFFKAVAQYPKGFYDTDEINQYPNENPYFNEAPIGSTKENAGRCHCRENENLEFFRYISKNQDEFRDGGESSSSSIQEAVWKKNSSYSSDENNYVDPITAEENMRFFKDVSRNPSDFYKTKATEEALSQAPRRRKPSIIEDDPRNYVDAKTADENMEFFKNHAKKSKKGKKKNL